MCEQEPGQEHAENPDTEDAQADDDAEYPANHGVLLVLVPTSGADPPASLVDTPILASIEVIPTAVANDEPTFSAFVRVGRNPLLTQVTVSSHLLSPEENRRLFLSEFTLRSRFSIPNLLNTPFPDLLKGVNGVIQRLVRLDRERHHPETTTHSLLVSPVELRGHSVGQFVKLIVVQIANAVANSVFRLSIRHNASTQIRRQHLTPVKLTN